MDSPCTARDASKPTVAILGASSDRSKYGNIAIHAHLKNGYEVFAVNPKGGQIEGLEVYRRLTDIPGSLNRVSVYLPPPLTLAVLQDIAAKGCDELFLNPGSESPEVVEKARQLGLDPIMACSIVALRLAQGGSD